MKANHVQPSRLIKSWVDFRGHPLLRRVCSSVTHSVAFQAIPNLRNLSFCLFDVERPFLSLFSTHPSLFLRTKLDETPIPNGIITDFAPTLHRLCTDFGTEDQRRINGGIAKDKRYYFNVSSTNSGLRGLKARHLIGQSVRAVIR